jgi:hypothetical protein
MRLPALLSCAAACCWAVLQEALRRQARPTSASLGLHMDPFTDSMADLETLDVRMEYAANMMQGVRGATRLSGRGVARASLARAAAKAAPSAA